ENNGHGEHPSISVERLTLGPQPGAVARQPFPVGELKPENRRGSPAGTLRMQGLSYRSRLSAERPALPTAALARLGRQPKSRDCIVASSVPPKCPAFRFAAQIRAPVVVAVRSTDTVPSLHQCRRSTAGVSAVFRPPPRELLQS